MTSFQRKAGCGPTDVDHSATGISLEAICQLGSPLVLSVLIGSDVPTDEALALARRAEQLGFSTVWLSEDLFYRGAIPRAAAILTTTERIQVGFSVLTPFHRHPVGLAMDLVPLLELGGERVILGLGSGVQAFVEQMGVPYRLPLRTIEENIEIVMGLLRGERLTYEGRVYQLDRLALDCEAPGTLPVYIGAMGDKALQFAGKAGDGVLLSVMSSTEYIRHARAQVQVDANPGAKPHVGVLMPVSIDTDGEAARNSVRSTVLHFLSRWRGKPALERLFIEFAGLSPERIDEIIAVAREKGEAVAEQEIPTSVIEHLSVAGTPEECRQRLHDLKDVGLNELVVSLSKGDNYGATLELIARHLMG